MLLHNTTAFAFDSSVIAQSKKIRHATIRRPIDGAHLDDAVAHARSQEAVVLWEGEDVEIRISNLWPDWITDLFLIRDSPSLKISSKVHLLPMQTVMYDASYYRWTEFDKRSLRNSKQRKKCCTYSVHTNSNILLCNPVYCLMCNLEK